jgi:amidase
MGQPSRIGVVEASIAELSAALSDGIVTSVGLVARYLNRIAFYDRRGIRLNSIPVLNPDVFGDARASDVRRTRGESLGPLDGIPYTAKDSYKVRGLTVAAGSPAFEHLVASDDAFAIERLRAAGAVLIGLTNMPPMANGGMQRGVYGRAESPYDANYLTAAFASGSSNGSGTATGASFGAFGMGEETWSSGRAPASNNGLVAYTPSRGVISVRGNWPLVPTMDVVVPHTRSVDDLLLLLETIVVDDTQTRGDFWRVQPWVAIPAASEVRPAAYSELRDRHALRGRRVGIPRMYINGDPQARAPIETRASIIELWERARADFERLGAEVVEVDFPVVERYERDRDGALSMVDRGLVPPDFAEHEIWELSMRSLDDFLAANGDPALHTLADVDGPKIFPHPSGALPDRYGEHDFDMAEYPRRARTDGIAALEDIPSIEAGLRGLEETRRIDLEEWMNANRLDVIVFPAVADIGPADSDVNPVSADLAWRNGTWVANGNQVIRHLGIPTVTVPLGVMSDIGMPVGLTFAGRAYDDSALLRYAYAFEASGDRRQSPARTPELSAGIPSAVPRAGAGDADAVLTLAASIDASRSNSNETVIRMSGRVVSAEGIHSLAVFVDGSEVTVTRSGNDFTAETPVVSAELSVRHSEWREPYGSLVLAIVTLADGSQLADFQVVGGIA